MPQSHNTRIRFLTYVWQERFGNYSTEDINQTEIEDEEYPVELVQRGIRSRLSDTGRYSRPAEAGVFQFHNLIRDFMKQ